MTAANSQTNWPWEAGLRWAFVMLALELGECLVLSEVVFFDRSVSGSDGGSGGFVHLYFGWVLTTFLFQLTGIILVIRGYHRAGAVLQFISSWSHVVNPRARDLLWAASARHQEW